VDENDKPIAGAAVLFGPLSGGPMPRRTRGKPLVTDRQGNFQFAQAVGIYQLRALARTPRGATSTAVEASAGDQVTLHVKAGGFPTITGRVTDAAGNAIAGAAVFVALQQQLDSNNFRVMIWDPGRNLTDARGRYTVAGFFPDMRHCIVIKADGYGPARTDFLGPFKPGEARQAPVLVLKKADGFVAGRVVDAAGNPIRRARVFIANEFSRPAATTGADGAFRIEGVAEAEFELSVQGYLPANGKFHAKAGTSENVLIVRRQSAPPL